VSPAARIERISIRVPGVERDLGLRLGQLVAEGLAPSLLLGPGEASLDFLRVQVSARPGESTEALAGRIAAEVSRRLGDRAVEAGR
jgi:hypothetical protein